MYVAGFNMPGYLPENEPTEWTTFQAALADQVSTAEHVYDTLHEEDDAEAWTKFIAELRQQTGPFEITAPDGYVVWVTVGENGQ